MSRDETLVDLIERLTKTKTQKFHRYWHPDSELCADIARCAGTYRDYDRRQTYPNYLDNLSEAWGLIPENYLVSEFSNTQMQRVESIDVTEFIVTKADHWYISLIPNNSTVPQFFKKEEALIWPSASHINLCYAVCLVALKARLANVRAGVETQA